MNSTRGLLKDFETFWKNSSSSSSWKRLASLKYFFRWRFFLDKKPIDMGIPWITFSAIDFLNPTDLCGKNVFEFGCGGSSIFFLRKGALVFSVEHNNKWIEEVQKTIRGESLNGWSVVHCPPEQTANFDPNEISDPTLFFSSDPDYKGMDFKNYAESILKYPDSFFDLILVDGRARPSCILLSIGKLKAGGLMIVDNSDRDYYFSDLQSELLKFGKPVEFEGFGPFIPGQWKTTFFKKSAQSI